MDRRHAGQSHLGRRRRLQQAQRQQHLHPALPLVHHEGRLDLWHQHRIAYDWKNKQWSVPINVTVGKLIKVGNRPISLTGGLRYWAESPDAGPKDLGFRFVVTFLFPK